MRQLNERALLLKFTRLDRIRKEACEPEQFAFSVRECRALVEARRVENLMSFVLHTGSSQHPVRAGSDTESTSVPWPMMNARPQIVAITPREVSVYCASNKLPIADSCRQSCIGAS